jgi:hypothetical protein
MNKYILNINEYTYMRELRIEALGCHRNQTASLGLDFVMESLLESSIDGSETG